MKQFLWAIAILAVVVCVGGPVWLYEVTVHRFHQLVRVNTTNIDLQRAVKAARKTLPIFEQRLKHPEPGERFAIKVGFETSAGPEYLWLKDPQQNAKGFSAVVDQHPVSAPVTMGERIQVRESDVYDWLVRKPDGAMAGGITDLALAPH